MAILLFSLQVWFPYDPSAFAVGRWALAVLMRSCVPISCALWACCMSLVNGMCMQQVLAEMGGAQIGFPCLKRNSIDIVCVEVLHVLPLTLSHKLSLVVLPGASKGSS